MRWHPPGLHPDREQAERKVCFRATNSVGVSRRGKSGGMSRRTDAWCRVTEVIHVCTTCRNAVGLHQGVKSGIVVRDVGMNAGYVSIAIAIVVGTPVVCRMVVVLLAESL